MGEEGGVGGPAWWPEKHLALFEKWVWGFLGLLGVCWGQSPVSEGTNG